MSTTAQNTPSGESSSAREARKMRESLNILRVRNMMKSLGNIPRSGSSTPSSKPGSSTSSSKPQASSSPRPITCPSKETESNSDPDAVTIEQTTSTSSIAGETGLTVQNDDSLPFPELKIDRDSPSMPSVAVVNDEEGQSMPGDNHKEEVAPAVESRREEFQNARKIVLKKRDETSFLQGRIEEANRVAASSVATEASSLPDGIATPQTFPVPPAPVAVIATTILADINHNNNNVESKTETFISILSPEVVSSGRSSLKLRPTSKDMDECDPPNRKQRTAQFDEVTVYYFPRTLGISSVPTKGGAPLGMTSDHESVQKFSLSEHAQEKRRVRNQMVVKQRHQSLSQSQARSQPSPPHHSELKEGQPLRLATTQNPSRDDRNRQAEERDSESDVSGDNYSIINPLSTIKRRALLEDAGVSENDFLKENDACREIRASRGSCGCSCKTNCDPKSCICALNGFDCYVDRPNFPCGCTKSGCKNPNGRKEFSAAMVYSHVAGTLKRIKLEKEINK